MIPEAILAEYRNVAGQITDRNTQRAMGALVELILELDRRIDTLEVTLAEEPVADD